MNHEFWGLVIQNCSPTFSWLKTCAQLLTMITAFLGKRTAEPHTMTVSFIRPFSSFLTRRRGITRGQCLMQKGEKRKLVKNVIKELTLIIKIFIPSQMSGVTFNEHFKFSVLLTICMLKITLLLFFAGMLKDSQRPTVRF